MKRAIKHQSLFAVLGFSLAFLPRLVLAGLVNPGFEYGQPAAAWSDTNDASSNPAGGWRTTAADHQIEVWGSGWSGVPAYQGTDFVVLNANAAAMLYQDTTGLLAGDTAGYSFAHRARFGNDSIELDVTDITTNQILFSQQFTDGSTAWAVYGGSFVVGGDVAPTDTIRVGYTSVSVAGSPAVGNFLDNADFGIGVAQPVSGQPTPGQQPIPEPPSSGAMTLATLGLGVRGLHAVWRYRTQAGRRIIPPPACAWRRSAQTILAGP